MTQNHRKPPESATLTKYRHRVAFYETDAMGVVHHANYVRFLELARVRWMAEHHKPYTEYVEAGLHFAVSRVEVDFHLPARFDDEITITAWLEWVRGASLRLAYQIKGPRGILVAGATEHAMIDNDGRLRRIPKEDRLALSALSAEQA